MHVKQSLTYTPKKFTLMLDIPNCRRAYSGQHTVTGTNSHTIRAFFVRTHSKRLFTRRNNSG